jgi:hypothetical protein
MWAGPHVVNPPKVEAFPPKGLGTGFSLASLEPLEDRDRGACQMDSLEEPLRDGYEPARDHAGDAHVVFGKHRGAARRDERAEPGVARPCRPDYAERE